jgi:pimeloyl-ACP methyl ester carboxylesterase
MLDYGGPVGFRMILAHPERAQALIVQDAVAHNSVEIQSDLFYDYRTNVDAYPKWQAWMREKNRACW